MAGPALHHRRQMPPPLATPPLSLTQCLVLLLLLLLLLLPLLALVALPLLHRPPPCTASHQRVAPAETAVALFLLVPCSLLPLRTTGN